MKHHLRWFIILLILSTFMRSQSLVDAQDGDNVLPYNSPVILTLNQGQTVTKSFQVSQGTGFELSASRLSEFNYSIVLIDPSQAASFLIPDANGAIFFAAEPSDGGLYFLIMVASGNSGGDLLLQLSNSSSPGSSALELGETLVDLTESVRSYDLSPPDGVETTLMIEGVPFDVTADRVPLPAFTLEIQDTNEVLLQLSAGLLPHITVILPPGNTYLLTLQPGVQPSQALVTWLEIPDSEVPEIAPSENSGTATVIPTPTGTVQSCTLTLSDTVNIRSGPGTSYPILGQLSSGTLPVLGRDVTGEWYQIDFNGELGWINSQIPAVETSGFCEGVNVSSTTPTLTATYTPSPTYTPGGPTLTATYTPSVTATSTVTYTPTYTQESPVLTATYTPTPTYTPTQPLTATSTFTPSYTPTTPPAPPTAPPDSQFNAPLNIPLDSTASVTDFVSYPGGDTEDRVRWDISGMNPNSSLSGGQARLILAVSCFGTGTQNIQFFTGGQTYSCGQTIVDRDVTYDSRTGQVTITAVAGQNTYVQWVLTGTATRIN